MWSGREREKERLIRWVSEYRERGGCGDGEGEGEIDTRRLYKLLHLLQGLHFDLKFMFLLHSSL